MIQFYRLKKENTDPDPYITNHPIISKQYSDQFKIKQRALLVALGLVYYMRLNTLHRKQFIEELEGTILNCAVKFKEAFDDEVCTNTIVVQCYSRMVYCDCLHRWTTMLRI